MSTNFNAIDLTLFASNDFNCYDVGKNLIPKIKLIYLASNDFDTFIDIVDYVKLSTEEVVIKFEDFLKRNNHNFLSVNCVGASKLGLWGYNDDEDIADWVHITGCKNALIELEKNFI